MNVNQSTKRRGFSLVELVIVIVIIGVIAAIAVPRISRGAKGAGAASVRGSLAGLRNSIDMFAAEHGGVFPASKTVNTEAEFLSQLLNKTDFAGVVGTTAGTHIYGPYLRGGLPPCPVGPNAGVKGLTLAATGPVVNEALTTIGWVYNYVTGDLIVNTDDLDEKGNGFDTY